MKRYPGGSEWRKWDLHVHLPGTKLSDGYTKNGGKRDWDRFADAIENSDVAVIGITDYFSAKDNFDFIRHFKSRFPKSEKLLLPNVEFRLNETVNDAGELVHFHVLFRDDVDETKVAEFLGALKTQVTVEGGKKLNCANLSTAAHYKSASISRDDLREAFVHAFGPKTAETDRLIYLAPANNDGVRAMKGNARKAALADEIDKTAHAFFGGSSNRDYFLEKSRYEGGKPKAPVKPVFSGCDAHNFDDLDAWLGKDVDIKGTRQEITWIKADPTFEGLQQTLIEPAERVAIRATRPDVKDDYKVIRAIQFTGSKDFPAEIVLNSNLNAIIGSRSSGKSALLAHIAHAIDPDYTVQQQVMATHQKETEVGPAAGKTWKSVAGTTCQIEWADPKATSGSVIYVPQNWLYEISENAVEVTAKIQPALEMNYPAFFREHQRLLGVANTANVAIGRMVDRWFELSGEIEQLEADIRKVGDKAAIEKSRDGLKAEIDRVRKEYALSEADLKKYQEVVSSIAAKTTRIGEIDGDKADLDPYVTGPLADKFSPAPGALQVVIDTTPNLDDLPEALKKEFETAISKAEKALLAQLETSTVKYRQLIEAERVTLESDRTKLEIDNKVLIEKHEANKALDSLVKRHKDQVDALASILALEKKRDERLADLATCETKIAEQLATRDAAFGCLNTNFDTEDRALDDLTFGLETAISREQFASLSEPLRKNELGTYVVKDAEGELVVDIDKAKADPHGFLAEIRLGTQKLNQGYDKVETSKNILQASPDVRFTAELEDDVIGGFEKSTMTPGKQALFALTLILNEAQDSWPLLIDQPEDDLDSRSIYAAIVPYLSRRKRERQIILVTHNANLVVGADAEEVIVANRHGDDSKNRDKRRFDYMTGSLEHSATAKSVYALEMMGIRQHACEILDGGEEAF